MILFIIIFSIALVLVLIAYHREGEIQSNWFVASLLVFAFGIAMLGTAWVIKFYMPNDLARIRALRDAANQVDLNRSEDIYGKVADFNIELASLQWQNRLWWSDPFIPDGWDTVTAIPVHK